MPLVMSFIRLHLQVRWLQQRQQICLVQTQSYSSRLTHGQPLLVQRKFNTWSLLEAVAGVLEITVAAVAQVDTVPLLVYL
jgi:hypothetical protein